MRQRILIIATPAGACNPAAADYSAALKALGDVRIISIAAPRWMPELLKPVMVAGIMLSLLPVLRRYDVLVTPNSAAAFFPALVQSVLGKRILAFDHIVIDVGATRYLLHAPRLLLAAVRTVFSSVACMVSYAESSRAFWQEQVRLAVPSQFIPMPVTDDLLAYPSACAEHAYAVSAGRYGRDYASLIAAAKDSPLPILIICDRHEAAALRRLAGSCAQIHIEAELPYAVYRERLAKCRFVILPLQVNGYHAGQTVLVQAMALGKAVIATATAGVVDYVDDGTNAVLVPPENVAALRDAIHSLADNQLLTEQLGLAARQKAFAEFSARRFGEQLYASIAYRHRNHAKT